MAVANSTEFTPTAYLEQVDGSQTMPDVSADFSILISAENLLPEVVLPDYKAILTLLTATDLTDPFASLRFVQRAGQQCISLDFLAGPATLAPITGIEWRAALILYTVSTTTWDLWIRRTASWELAQTQVQDFTGTPIIKMRLLGDAIASVPDVGGGFFRMWGKLITVFPGAVPSQAETEVNSAVAVETDQLITDTPLQYSSDLTDVSGNGNDWTPKPDPTALTITPWTLGPSWAESPTGTFTYTNTGLDPAGDTLASSATGGTDRLRVSFSVTVTGSPAFSYRCQSDTLHVLPLPEDGTGVKNGLAIWTGDPVGLEVVLSSGGGLGDTIVITAVTIDDITGIGPDTVFPPPPTFTDVDAFYPAIGQETVWRHQNAAALRDDPIDVTAGQVVASCGARDGNPYFLCDDFTTGFTSIQHGELTVSTTLHLGSTGAGYHTVMELDHSHVGSGDAVYHDLLTIDRDSGDVVRVNTEDGTVLQTYGLNLAVLDGAVNSAGTRLIYTNGAGGEVSGYNLETDATLGVLFTAATPLFWPVWLSDCTMLFSTAGWHDDGPLQRYNLSTGTLINPSYAYSPTPFSNGQVGIAADSSANKVYVVGNWDDGSQTSQMAALVFSLSSGAQLYPPVPLIGNSDGEVGVLVSQPYVTLMCTPMPPPPPEPVTSPVRRYMRFMFPWDDANRMKFISRIELVMKVGIGDISGPFTDPIVMLRFSKDGGETFGTEIQMRAGEIGQYLTRVYVNRLPQARNPVVELTVSDAVNWQMIQVLADMESGTS